MKIHSPAFKHDQPIPRVHTREGKDVSPALAWEEAPPGKRELALICDDPDAPTPKPWVHWVIYQIPGDVRGSPEGVPQNPTLHSPPGALQGQNSWDAGENIGYRGPMPPRGHGTHHYHFRIYALDAPLELAAGLDVDSVRQAMAGHILGEGVLTGTYER